MRLIKIKSVYNTINLIEINVKELTKKCNYEKELNQNLPF